MKETVAPVVGPSQGHNLFVSPVKNIILLPAPTGVHSDCAGAVAPMGEIGQGEPRRVTDGKLPI